MSITALLNQSINCRTTDLIQQERRLANAKQARRWTGEYNRPCHSWGHNILTALRVKQRPILGPRRLLSWPALRRARTLRRILQQTQQASPQRRRFCATWPVSTWQITWPVSRGREKRGAKWQAEREVLTRDLFKIRDTLALFSHLSGSDSQKVYLKYTQWQIRQNQNTLFFLAVRLSVQIWS